MRSDEWRRAIEKIPNRQSLRLGLSCRPWCPRHQGRRRIGSPPKSGQTSTPRFVSRVKDSPSLAENRQVAIPRLWYGAGNRFWMVPGFSRLPALHSSRVYWVEDVIYRDSTLFSFQRRFTQPLLL